MKKPLLDQINRGMRGQVGSAPAPIGGWNTRDSIANMNPSDAVILDNFFPSSTSVDLRQGSANWVTGLAIRVATLMSYASPTISKMFGATDTGIYDVSTSGVAPAAATTLSLGYCQYVNFSNAAGAFMQVVNGLDSLRMFDGTTWTTLTPTSSPIAITGLPGGTAAIVNINSFKNRIWYVLKDSLNVYYLPVASLGGAAVQFGLSGLFTRGGYLMAMGTWTVDGGAGVDDLAVFVTSEGEIAVYQGTDPASPSTWGLIGVYYIGEPLGRRCLIKYGGDLLYLSKRGLFPLSSALQSASVDKTIALSDKINPTFNDSASTYGNNLGWQSVVSTADNMLIVNVPTLVGTQSYQYVMNLISKSWCRFTGWNAACFLVWKNELYYGSEGTVIKALNGVSDLGNFITGVGLTAYSYLNYPGIKHFKLLRPVLKTTSDFDLYVGIDVDFEDNLDYTIVPQAAAVGALWDSAIWDSSMWAGGLTTSKKWNSINVNDGFAAAAKLQVRTKLSVIQWQSTDFLYETGGVL